MAVQHLTERKLQTLHTPKAQEDFWDESLPGFGVRVTQSGRKSFVLMYRLHGLKRRLTLGTYPALSLADARQRAKTLLGEVACGRDPAAEKQGQRDAITLGELVEMFLERHARHQNRANTWREYERLLRRDVLASWRHRPARDVRRRDVAALLDTIVERGAPATAEKVRATISVIYNWAIGRDLVEHNPCFALRCPVKSRSRDRVLNAAEIRTVWAKLEQLMPIRAASMKLRLLTAQRGGEILRMRWDQIEGSWWTIPAEVAKNHKSHRVYLASQTLGILEQLRVLGKGSPWVFPSPVNAQQHLGAGPKASRRLAAISGVSFQPHDLRRTAATMMTQMGIQRLVVSKVLNHTRVDANVTAVYDRHSYDPEKQDALCRWADRLEQIVGDLLEPSGRSGELAARLGPANGAGSALAGPAIGAVVGA
jgi:integrase